MKRDHFQMGQSLISDHKTVVTLIKARDRVVKATERLSPAKNPKRSLYNFRRNTILAPEEKIPVDSNSQLDNSSLKMTHTIGNSSHALLHFQDKKIMNFQQTKNRNLN